MSMVGLDVFDNTIQKTNLWLKDIMKELGTEDKHRAYLALRAVLQTLRDRLTIEEASELGAQLPMLVRGFYYDGWKPSNTPLKIRDRQEFLNHIKRYFPNEPDIDAEKTVKAVMAVIESRITAGEIEDIRRMLPAEFRDLVPETARK